MPSADELHRLVASYAATVNSRDIEAYVAQFTEDAVQADPIGNPPNVGQEAIRAFWTQTIEGSQGITFEPSGVHSSGQTVAFNFKVTVALEGATTVISGIETFEVAEDGRIAYVRAYWDDRDITFS
jgi:steroid Delta-isomerase